MRAFVIGFEGAGSSRKLRGLLKMGFWKTVLAVFVGVLLYEVFDTVSVTIVSNLMTQ